MSCWWGLRWWLSCTRRRQSLDSITALTRSPRQLYVDTMATTFYPPISHNDLLREEELSAVTLLSSPPSPLPPLSSPTISLTLSSPTVPRAGLAPLLPYRHHRLYPQRPARMHHPPGAHRSRLNPGALLRSQRSAEGVRHARREPDCEGGHAGEDVRAAKHKRAAGPQAYDSGLGPRVDAGAADGCEQLREGEPAAARRRERRGVSRGGRDGPAV